VRFDRIASSENSTREAVAAVIEPVNELIGSTQHIVQPVKKPVRTATIIC
jgi:hypothetical protein